MSQVKIPTFTLNDGRDIPALGYGTWLSLDDKNEVQIADLPKMVEAMSYAIEVGYRHIDTAHVYRVEPDVGQVINKKIQEGVVKREDMFVTTKVWNHMHREADVEVAVRGSLRRLKLDYLDLVLIHWPMSVSPESEDDKIDYLQTWRGMETVLKKGLTKSIGVSNFNVEQLQRLLKNCKVPPACNQVEINLNLGQDELVSFCQSNKILVIAYAPFGTIVPSRAVPDSPEPKLNNPTMVAIAKKHGKTVTQVALRYLYERGVATLPKTITKSRALENASIFDFSLDKADTEALKAFDVGYRSVRPVFWESFQNYPFDKVNQKVEIPLSLLKWKNGANEDIE